MAQQEELTITEILRDLATEYDTITSQRHVFDRVLQRRPSQAKNPYASIRSHLRYDAPRYGWVMLGRNEMVPLRVVLEGLKFRITLSAEDIAAGTINSGMLRPFMPINYSSPRFETSDGSLIVQPEEVQLPRGSAWQTFTFDLRQWMRHVGMAAGDSILVTIHSHQPLTFRLVREAAADFRADAAATQEADLIAQLNAAVAQTQRGPTFVEQVLLPIYARAPWRTTYPGRSWQELVRKDSRLQLIDNEMISTITYRNPLWMLGDEEEEEEALKAIDEALLGQIMALQSELLASRRQAAERGIWDGLVPRISTAHTMFDFEAGTSTTIYPGAIDALADHATTIEEHIANGDYEEEDSDEENLYADAYGFNSLDIDLLLDAYPGEPLDDIDNIKEFLERNPQLAEATKRLMQMLSPEEKQRFESARSPEELETVLAPHLRSMIRYTPSLFVPLDTSQLNEGGVNSENGNHQSNDISADSDLFTTELWDGTENDDEDDEDDWGESDDEAEEQPSDIQAALERSTALTDEFIAYQQQNGKSSATARSRAGDCDMYADFLSRYYGRSLEQGDYATLDEFVFFFYPRKVMNSSPRNTREICISIKQFYAFLKAQNTITDDAFAAAIWQRREQAARVVEIYDQIDGDSPQFERLFAYLFSPYTA